MIVRVALGGFRLLAVLYLTGVVAQVYSAGRALFGLSTFGWHATFGYPLVPASLLLLILAFPARLGREARLGSAILVVLTLIQPVLALSKTATPALAALHPVVALVIFAVAVRMVRIALAAARPSGKPLPVETDGRGG